jgi:uncharacterized membrane protein
MMFFGWIILAVILYYAFGNKDGSRTFVQGKSPREVLDDRFVNGEIDEETYKRMKKALEER